MAVIKQGININRRFKCFLTSKSLIIDIELINIVTKPIQSKMLIDSNSVTGSNEDTQQYDTLFVADDTVVEGFPTRHYKYKEDNIWECVSEDYRGYFIQKLDENQIYNDEIYDCTIYTKMTGRNKRLLLVSQYFT